MLTTALLLVAALTTSAPPAPAANRIRVLMLDFKPSGGVEPNVVENITGLSAAILSEDKRLEVIAGPDLRSMIDLQAQKGAAGCSGDAVSSCIAELAGALDAKLVVIGNVGYIGSALNLNLVLFDQATGKNAGRRAVQAKDLSELSTSLRPPLHALIDDAIGARVDEGGGLSPGLLLVVGGAVGAVAGVALLGVSAYPTAAINGEEDKFNKGDPGAFAAAQKLQADWFDSGLAAGAGITGAVLLVGGAAAVAGGLVMGVE